VSGHRASPLRGIGAVTVAIAVVLVVIALVVVL